jgi:hypothetical protein
VRRCVVGKLDRADEAAASVSAAPRWCVRKYECVASLTPQAGSKRKRGAKKKKRGGEESEPDPRPVSEGGSA